ncbi:MAG: hypothetical protein L0Z55_02685 [Planctomycetes bacterium]|nr:hypothetical protein [Planctomycetota bacterium]
MRPNSIRDPRPDGDTPPSTLFLLCPGADPPQWIEVAERLRAIGMPATASPDSPDSSEMDDESMVVWSATIEFAGAPNPYLVLLEKREESFMPWEWCDARWGSQEEFDEAQSARWNLVLESVLDPAHPNESYHKQLRIAAALCEGLAAACYDANSMMLRSATTLRELAACQEAPAPSELFHIDYMSEGERVWIHSHGLRRFDLPELEIFEVPSERAVVAVDAMQWLAAYVLGERIPSMGCVVEFGDGIVTRLRPVQEMISLHSPELLGGTADHDEFHEGWRLALTDADQGPRNLAPVRLLEAVGGDAVFWLSEYESDRRARLARERFGVAATLFYSTRFREREFLVKIGVPADERRTDYTQLLAEGEIPKDASREPMWFRVLSVARGRLQGKLIDRPLHATFLSEGETYKLQTSQVSDYEIRLDDHLYTPENITEAELVTLRTYRRDED